MRDIGIGVIGTGFMGKTHALAYRAVAGSFSDVPRPRLIVVADIDEAGAKRAAEQFGFVRSTSDWKSVTTDPEVAVVSITTPNVLHKEQALAAIAAGKHVHCEKPIAPSAADAKVMMEAAEAAGVTTQVGYNYTKNPILGLARSMIANGDLGEIISFRGIHAEDYMGDPEIPYNWRVDPSGGGGAIADLGSHIIGLSRFLLGPIVEVNAALETVIRTRPTHAGSEQRRKVEVDDIGRVILRFERGCGGSIEANWVSIGKKMQLGFEVTGTKGALVFSQERLNELQYYRAGSNPQTAGFVRIEAGPQHPPYGNFIVAPGHQLGFNDLKTIEVADFLKAIAGGPMTGPDFREAWEIQKVIDTSIRSSRERSWLNVS